MKLKPTDIDLYRELMRAALMESPILFIESLAEFERHSLEALSAHIENDNGFSLGAFDGDGHLVGMVDFRRESSLRLDHIGFIGNSM